jgi:amino acid transporter
MAHSSSPGRLHRKLSSFGVLLLTVSCLSPAMSIYGVGADVLKTAGTAAAGLFVFGFVVAMVLGMVYAELASAYPYAGGDYVGIGFILGPSAALASLSLWAATAGPSVAFMAKTVAIYVGELTPAVPGTFATFGSLGLALTIALLAVRTGAVVTGIFLAIEMAAVLALVFAGFAHPARSLVDVIVHPQALDASGVPGPTGLAAIALGAVSAAFATCGGNQAIVFGEELRDPHRRMGNVVMLSAMIGGIAIALPVIAVVLGARDLTSFLGSPAPISAFIESVAGPAASKVLSAAVALAVFNGMIVVIMFYGRLFFSLGRDGIFHARVNGVFARVHTGSGAPRAATLFAGAFAAVCCLLDSHTLVVFIAGMLPYLLALVSLAVLVGRSRRFTGQPGCWRSPFFPLAPILGFVTAVALGVADLLDADAGRPSTMLLAAVVVAALLWHRLVLRRRPGGWRPRIADEHARDRAGLG